MNASCEVSAAATPITLRLQEVRITDVNMVEVAPDENASKRSTGINVVRYGIATQSTVQK